MQRTFLSLLFILTTIASFAQMGQQGLFLDGGSAYLSIPDTPAFDIPSGMTIEAWINPCEMDDDPTIIGKQICGQYSYRLYLRNGHIRFGWDHNGNCPLSGIVESALPVLAQGIWQHIAITHSDTAIQIYHNGLAVSSTIVQGSLQPIFNSTSPVVIGANILNSGGRFNFFKGGIDEVRMWNAYLSPTDISGRYSTPLSGSEPNLVLYHNFETVSGPTLPNSAVLTGTLGDAQIIDNDSNTAFVLPFTGAISNINLGPDTIVCGDTLILYADTSTFSYTWIPGANTIPTDTITQSGPYAVQYAVGSCVYGDTINISFSTDDLSLGMDTTLCGSSYVIQAGVYDSYAWSTGSADSAISATGTANYSVTVTRGACIYSDSIFVELFSNPEPFIGNDTLLCDGDSITIAPVLSYAQYQWSGGSTTDSLIISGPGSFAITVTDTNNCSGSDTINVTYLIPNALLGADTSVCQGDSLTLSVINSSIASYAWSTGSGQNSITTGAGDYSVTVSIGSACSAIDSITVSEYNTPQPNLPDTSYLCTGDSLPLFPGLFSSYAWSTGDTGLFLPVYGPGLYTLTVTDVNSCIGFDTSLVIEAVLPNLSLTGGSLCPGDSLTLRPSADKPVSWQWADGSTNDFLVVNQASRYSVVATDSVFGCTDSVATIVSELAFEPAILPGDTALCPGTSVYLTFSNPLGSIFVDGIEVFDPVKVEEPGSFVFRAEQVCDTTERSVIVAAGECDCTYDFPNVFTPNGDGVNDWFYAENPCILNVVSFQIYNRWGSILFETTENQLQWDGYQNGVPTPEGTYFFRIQYTTEAGQSESTTGYFNLLR